MKKTKKPAPFTFSIVPNSIKPEQGLSPSAKLIYGDIYSLVKQRGFCFASNTYFEKLYGVSKSTVTKSISDLQKLEYIICEYQHRNSRKIYITTKKCPEVIDLSQVEDFDQVDDDEIQPSMQDSNHLKRQKRSSSSLKSTNLIVSSDQDKVKNNKVELKIENNYVYTDIQELYEELLDIITMIYPEYSSYEYYDIEERIASALSDDNCKTDINRLGLKDWLHTAIDKNTLRQSDFDDIDKNMFLRFAFDLKQPIFDILSS